MFFLLFWQVDIKNNFLIFLIYIFLKKQQKSETAA